MIDLWFVCYLFCMLAVLTAAMNRFAFEVQTSMSMSMDWDTIQVWCRCKIMCRRHWLRSILSNLGQWCQGNSSRKLQQRRRCKEAMNFASLFKIFSCVASGRFPLLQRQRCSQSESDRVSVKSSSLEKIFISRLRWFEVAVTAAKYLFQLQLYNNSIIFVTYFCSCRDLIVGVTCLCVLSKVRMVCNLPRFGADVMSCIGAMLLVQYGSAFFWNMQSFAWFVVIL